MKRDSGVEIEDVVTTFTLTWILSYMHMPYMYVTKGETPHFALCWKYLTPFAHEHPQSALGWDHQEQLSKHESQTDAAKGFGGKYGVQKESQDKVGII